MKSLYYFLLSLLFPEIPFNGLLAQPVSTDTGFYQQTLQQTTRFYKNTIRENRRIYYGSEYIRVSNDVKGTPFFLYDTLQTGAIFYDGVLYNDIPLLYDIYQDAVVINEYANGFQIKLVSEKITYFNWSTHLFIRITTENTAGLLNSGFYEVLYGDTTTNVLAKRVKKLVAGYRVEDAQQFVQQSQLYIKSNNIYTRIKNKQSLLAVFSNKKEAIKKYWATGNLNFRKDLETATVKTMEYYMKLKD